MGYLIVNIEISKQGSVSFADFDARKYEDENGVTLNGDPLLIQIDGNRLVLVFNADNKKREKFKPAVA